MYYEMAAKKKALLDELECVSSSKIEARSFDDWKRIAEVQLRIANFVSYILENKKEALSWYEHSITSLENGISRSNYALPEDYYRLAWHYNNAGLTSSYLEKLDKALDYFKYAIKLFERLPAEFQAQHLVALSAFKDNIQHHVKEGHNQAPSFN